MERQRLFFAVSILVLALSTLYVYVHTKNSAIPLLEPAGPIAAGELDVIIMVAAFSSIIIIPVFFLLFYFAWKYRASAQNAEHHEPNWDHDSRVVEFSWWFVPGVIIVILAAVAWRTSHTLDPYVPLPGDALTVEVVALNWKWLFLYPQEGVASLNELEIPAGKPIHFVMTADAPMNSFWIPQLGGQIMVMPGMTTQLYLKADKVGIYKGYSANISGKGFSGMTFDAHAVPEADFNAWVDSVHSRPTLDKEEFLTLAKPSEYNTPTTYAFSDTSLYAFALETSMGMAPSSTPATGDMMQGMQM